MKHYLPSNRLTESSELLFLLGNKWYFMINASTFHLRT